MSGRPIARGTIYHSVAGEVGDLARATFSRLDHQPTVRRFEQVFARRVEADHCVAFPMARVAIHAALSSQDFAPGAKIIMPPITIKGILDCVLDLGLTPVFVDLDPETVSFDIDKLEKALVADDIEAVIVTYLFGMVPDVGAMMELFASRGVFVVEDFSQCLGGRLNGRHVGTFGHVGVYSASSIKTLDTYGGGIAVTADEELATSLREAQASLAPPSRRALLSKIRTNLGRNVATSSPVFQWLVFPLLRLLARYRPDSAIKHIGNRSLDPIDLLPAEWFQRYTSLQAEVGLREIGKVAEGNKARVANVERIRKEASTIGYPSGVEGAANVYWQLLAYVDDAQAAQQALHRAGIDTSTSSLVLVSELPAYHYRSSTPVARRILNDGLLVPAYPSLSESDVERVADALKDLPPTGLTK